MSSPRSAESLAPLFAFEHQPVRIEMIDGEPWFCARDVAACLGMSVSAGRNHLAALDEDEKGIIPTDTPGGRQGLGYVTESGLYAMALAGRKAQARRFRRWVSSEVLPAIRKTGRYEAAPMSHAEMTLAVIRGLEEQIASERERRLLAEGRAEAMRPMAEYAAAVSASGVERTPRDVFRLLGARQREAFDWLRDNVYQVGRTVPYSLHIDAGRFTVREVPWKSSKGSSQQCYVTPRGAAWMLSNMPPEIFKPGDGRELARAEIARWERKAVALVEAAASSRLNATAGPP